MARGKRYDETFKKQIASRVIRGEDLKEVAKDSGVSHYTLGDWVREYRPKKRTIKRKVVRRKPTANSGGKSYETLEQENDKLKMEIEFWKNQFLDTHRKSIERG